ncbi:hypothetical protein [Luteolibacter soli]|uniref:HNH endonuclease n=1 Tax=Luteolibacter soli TaxID=3135280 RepID=A0ABU9AVM7_9BACT
MLRIQKALPNSAIAAKRAIDVLPEKRMTMKTCYMCHEPGVSKEHVPPRCIFPETKDVQENLRQNLITVPSCDLHNSQKSDDDAFLLVSLAGIIGNNSIGYRQKITKVNRALKRSAFRLLHESLSNPRIELLEYGPNQFVDVIWGTPDYDRLSTCFDRIARGLHFHHFGTKFTGRTRTLLGYTANPKANPREFQRFICEKVASELKDKPRLGANPEVFSFQFTDPDHFGLFVVHLQFYGGMDVFVGFMPADWVKPPDLVMELINLGIETIIREDGKTYIFNRKPTEQDQRTNPSEESKGENTPA